MEDTHVCWEARWPPNSGSEDGGSSVEKGRVDEESRIGLLGAERSGVTTASHSSTPKPSTPMAY